MSSKIGEWEFGSIYKATIKHPTNHEFVVKSINESAKGPKKWVKKVNAIGLVEHPNIVKLVGFCAEDNETGARRLLVYAYNLNTRSVEDRLDTCIGIPLSWSIRLKVAKEAASGLAHLHEGMAKKVIVGDFKSSNVLLDEYSCVKLSDYGLARLVPRKKPTHVSDAVVETMEHAAPEYIRTGNPTTKSDVWSFGLFLYELITGRCQLDKNLPISEQNLLKWVKPYLDSGELVQIIDSRLEGNYSLKSVQKLSIIANMCLSRNPKSRPKMSDVVKMVDKVMRASALADYMRSRGCSNFEDMVSEDESGWTGIKHTEPACFPRPPKHLKSCFTKIYCCA